MCALHRTDGMVNLRSNLQADESEPHSAPFHTTNCVTPQANHRAQLAEPRAVEPETSAETPVAENSEAPSISTFSTGSPSTSGNDVSSSASTRTLTRRVSASSRGKARSAPSGAASALDERRLVRPEAEPTPATVPDPAELKRGTCEVRFAWCRVFFQSKVGVRALRTVDLQLYCTMVRVV